MEMTKEIMHEQFKKLKSNHRESQIPSRFKRNETEESSCFQKYQNQCKTIF